MLNQSEFVFCVVKMTECAEDVCRQGVSVCMQQDLFGRHLSRPAGQFLSISTVSRYSFSFPISLYAQAF